MDNIIWNKYKLVLFDFDNTMYEPQKMVRYIVPGDLRHALYSFNERKARKALAGIDHNSQHDLQQQLCSFIARKLNKETAKVERWYLHSYLPMLVRILRRHYRPRPDMQRLIDHLEAHNINVGVLSDYPLVRQRLHAIGINVNSQRLWSTEEAGALKPNPRPIIEISRETDIPLDNILVIGDRPDTDGLAARNAGCDAIIVRTNKKNTDNFLTLTWSEIVGSAMKQL